MFKLNNDNSNIKSLSSIFKINRDDLNFNPRIRDEFVKQHLSNLPPTTKVLDISSGNKPYKHLFEHCIYKCHEFEGNKEIIDTFRGEKNKKMDHDFYSPIDNIPVPDNEFDILLCTEVFEHIPEPIKAMEEFVRICKPGGKILITAPFTSGIHQEPHHFYSGFSPFFYNYLKDKFSLKITEFKSQGDLFLLSHQFNSTIFGINHPTIMKNPSFKKIFNDIREFVMNYTINLSKSHKNKESHYNNPENMLKYEYFNQFTIGYCVIFEK